MPHVEHPEEELLRDDATPSSPDTGVPTPRRDEPAKRAPRHKRAACRPARRRRGTHVLVRVVAARRRRHRGASGCPAA